LAYQRLGEALAIFQRLGVSKQVAWLERAIADRPQAGHGSV
jgi:hypothetical protein